MSNYHPSVRAEDRVDGSGRAVMGKLVSISRMEALERRVALLEKHLNLQNKRVSDRESDKLAADMAPITVTLHWPNTSFGTLSLPAQDIEAVFTYKEGWFRSGILLTAPHHSGLGHAALRSADFLVRFLTTPFRTVLFRALEAELSSDVLWGLGIIHAPDLEVSLLDKPAGLLPFGQGDQARDSYPYWLRTDPSSTNYFYVDELGGRHSIPAAMAADVSKGVAIMFRAVRH